MYPKSYDPPKGVYPTEDDDWIWYRPINEHPDEPKPEGSGVYHVAYSCTPCDVSWKQWVSDTINPQCFCCGAYQRKTLY